MVAEFKLGSLKGRVLSITQENAVDPHCVGDGMQVTNLNGWRFFG